MHIYDVSFYFVSNTICLNLNGNQNKPNTCNLVLFIQLSQKKVNRKRKKQSLTSQHYLNNSTSCGILVIFVCLKLFINKTVLNFEFQRLYNCFELYLGIYIF